MKKMWTSGSVVLTLGVAAGVGLHAQNAGSNREESSITVTGCLQSAGASRDAVGTSGSAAAQSGGAARSAAAGNSAGPFMLVNARVGNAPGGGSAVTSIAPPGSGTTESAARAGSTSPSPALSGAIDKNGQPAGAGLMYTLKGDNTELPRHVGQEVEISGRLMQAGAVGSASSTSGSSSASGAANTGTSAAAAGATQDLEVRTVRMIASSCVTR